MSASRPTDRLRKPFCAPGVVSPDRAASIDKQRRYQRMRMALETIAKLEMFDDPADAANAAIKIATEALK